MPSNILTVYRPSNRSTKLIAKKVREESNELEILKLPNNSRSKSKHTILLFDSFQTQSKSWAIFPKLASVAAYFTHGPNELYRKVTEVCWGLIDGVAYLHGSRIAHRDIKPDNLLVGQNFCLKIIDFDIAMLVKDEDEEVDDQCGTKHWMAPEVEKKLRHSPIRADRWACGHVLLFLLDNLRTEDKPLRAFARNLEVHDPKQRPPLSEWRRLSTLLLSDVGNVGDVQNVRRTKASRPRRGPMEVDDDNVRPAAKKQRL